MKKIYTFIELVLVVLLIMMVSNPVVYAESDGNTKTSKNTNYNDGINVINEILEEYNKQRNYNIETIETISDFDDNFYTLCSLSPKGYIIVDNEMEEMIEGSFETPNPYNNSGYSGEKYYIGPMNYLIQQNERYYSVFDEKIVNYSEGMKISSQQLHYQITENLAGKEDSSNEVEIYNLGGDGSTDGSTVDSSGFTVVNEHEYFRDLDTFPVNIDGTCGFVALSILLGYIDTFENVNTIPNMDITFNGVTDELLVKGETSYLPDADNRITLDKWTKMPGTNNHLHNILFSYGHYLYYDGLDPFEWFDGYGADAYHLAATFRDYRDDWILVSNRPDYELVYGRFFNTHTNTKTLIDEGIPTIIVMSSYSATNVDQTKWHDVVAYGYKDDTFLAHFGWGPGYATYSEIIINSATIESYFAIRYTGTYRRAGNTKIIGIPQIWYVDGQGYIMTSSSC